MLGKSTVVHNQFRGAGQEPPQVKRIPASHGKVYNIFLDRLLGKGTFAQVYVAQLEGASSQPGSGTELAVKVVSQENLKRWGDKGRRNLQRELHILSIIKHRNIVRLDDFIQTANNYYLVFEHCTGGDLQSYLKEKGALDEFEAQSIVYQLALALRQLSHNEIMHRDLKPQNILLSGSPDDPVVKLADFGLAKYYQGGADDDADNADTENTVCGTPVYMAPEILDYREYGKEADLWSAGAIFLELVVGNRPWQNTQNRAEIASLKKQFFYRFAEGSVDLAQKGIQISPLYQHLLKEMLQKDPKNRMTWSQFFQHPVVANDPQVYRELLPRILHQKPDQQEGFADKTKSAQEVLPQAMPANPVNIPPDHQQIEDKANDQPAQKVQDSFEDKNLVKSVIFTDEDQGAKDGHSDTLQYVEDFKYSQDLANDVVQALYDQAHSLQALIDSELHEFEEQNLTQAPYQFVDELGFLVLKLLMEIREVLETFCTKEFLGLSDAAKESGEPASIVQGQIQSKEYDELIQSIFDIKEKNMILNSKLQQWQRHKKSPRNSHQQQPEDESGNNRASITNSNEYIKNTVLSVLIRSPQQAKNLADQKDGDEKDGSTEPLRIVFNDLLLQKLKERHGKSLVPLIHKLQLAYISLSNFLSGLNYQDRLPNGEQDGLNQKQLGQKLLAYAVDLSEQAGLEESLFNSQKAHSKYTSSLYVIKECMRQLNMESRFDSEIDESGEAAEKSSPQRSSQDIQIQATLMSQDASTSKFVSFSFVRDEDMGDGNNNGQRECMFDLKTDLILVGLQQMVEERIEVVKKSPYFLQ